ncbi:MAG: NADH:flavin oxidoreductase, partial [Deltaproteobacteria bacterium]|nr:NADH:flavin oxidoreductase [Deltaproteobacteria bacterium]
MKEIKVFTPISIGSMTLKNRIVLAALQTSLCHDGYPTEPFIAFFEHLAKSGASMINVGGATVSQDPPGLQFPSGPAVADDKLIPGLSRVADTIKMQGAKACLQLFHPGRGASTYAASRYGITPWSASSTRPFLAAVDWKITKEGDQWDVQQVLEPLPVRGITKEEIKQVVIMNVMGALRAMAAGFDAINLHFANVTLVMDFMSPYTNTRTDEYGGDWVGRMRLPCEILQAIRSAVGPYYPITVRIPVDQGVGEAGIQIDDVVKHIVPRLEEAGADAIDVSAGILDAAPDYIIPPMYYPRGLYMKHAEAIKKATKLPVLAVGRLCDPRLIERFIETDRCDVVQVCRPLLADPELPKKMMQDRYDDVRMCVACGYCASG